MHLLFIRKKLFIFTCHLLARRYFHSNSKTTIDYNNTLTKVQMKYIATVNDSKTHSERPACIKILKGTVLYLYSLPGQY